MVSYEAIAFHVISLLILHGIFTHSFVLKTILTVIPYLMLSMGVCFVWNLLSVFGVS